MQVRHSLLSAVANLSFVLVIVGCKPVTAPQPSESVAPPLPVPPSHVAVPVSVPMALPQTAINNAVPQSMGAAEYNVNINGGADNCGNGVSLGYQAQRAPIILGGSGNTLTANTSIAYNVGARFKRSLIFGACTPLIYVSCGQGEPEPNLNVSLSVTLDGINPNWTPSLTFKAGVSPAGACKASMFNIHVENNIAGFVQTALNNNAAAAQSGVANAINLPDKANKAWTFLETPIKLAPSVWLSGRPQQIGIQPLVVTPSAITSGLYLQAMPVISYGDAVPVAGNTPLPAPSSVPASNSYFISVPIQSDYANINKQIQNALKLQSGGIRYPPTGSNYLTVTGADVYAYGQKAVLRLELKIHGIFGKSAILYLTGTPTFDTGRNIISFPDLQFTADSQNILTNIAVWVEQSAIRDDLRSRATYDITPYVNDAKQKLLVDLNQNIGSASLKGTVDAVNILGVYSNPDKNAFSASLQTSGTLNVTIK